MPATKAGRRTDGSQNEMTIMSGIAFGSYVLDAKARQLFFDGAAVHLEPKAMDLLLYLVENRARCVSKDELLAKLWPQVSVGQASVTRLVKKLRKSLTCQPDAAPLLRTVHGRGYQFVGRNADPAPELGTRSPLEAEPVQPAAPARLHVGPGLSKIVAPLKHVAAFGLPVILEGEPGTGKTCLARALHAWSGRRGELVTVCCAQVTEAELDAALAKARTPNQTLLIQEVAELPPHLQNRLMTQFSSESVSSQTSLLRRSVLTAQRSLSGMAERGELRADLLARLHGISVELPPLRKRREDIGGLVDCFLERSSSGKVIRLPQPVLHDLTTAYDWPFNVLELEMFVLRWIAFSGSGFEVELSPAVERATVSIATRAGARPLRQARSSCL